jgi:hypothetical protein
MTAAGVTLVDYRGTAAQRLQPAVYALGAASIFYVFCKHM